MLIAGTAVSKIHLRTALNQEQGSSTAVLFPLLLPSHHPPDCATVFGNIFTAASLLPLGGVLALFSPVLLLLVNEFSRLLFPWGWLACCVFTESLLCQLWRQKGNPGATQFLVRWTYPKFGELCQLSHAFSFPGINILWLQGLAEGTTPQQEPQVADDTVSPAPFQAIWNTHTMTLFAFSDVSLRRSYWFLVINLWVCMLQSKYSGKAITA